MEEEAYEELKIKVSGSIVTLFPLKYLVIFNS